MVLGLAASVYVHTAGEDFVNLGEAETSVQGGAFEGRAVSGEGNALWDWISKHLAAIFGSSGMMTSWEITSAWSLP